MSPFQDEMTLFNFDPYWFSLIFKHWEENKNSWFCSKTLLCFFSRTTSKRQRKTNHRVKTGVCRKFLGADSWVYISACSRWRWPQLLTIWFPYFETLPTYLWNLPFLHWFIMSTKLCEWVKVPFIVSITSFRLLSICYKHASCYHMLWFLGLVLILPSMVPTNLVHVVISSRQTHRMVQSTKWVTPFVALSYTSKIINEWWVQTKNIGIPNGCE